MARLKITQVRSKIGGNESQRESLRSLGLRRIGQVVIKEDGPRSGAWSPWCRTW